jgi:succinate dehydrogenase / fumarate reductase, membrane anchor subunit
MNTPDHSLRTTLGRVRGLGAAKSGVHHWWMQRVTAVALVPLTLWFVIGLIGQFGEDHASMVAWLSGPVTATIAVLTVFALFYHAKLGLQVVIEDYVHTEWLKITSLIVLKLVVIFLGGLSILSILKIAFGG